MVDRAESGSGLRFPTQSDSRVRTAYADEEKDQWNPGVNADLGSRPIQLLCLSLLRWRRKFLGPLDLRATPS